MSYSKKPSNCIDCCFTDKLLSGQGCICKMYESIIMYGTTGLQVHNLLLYCPATSTISTTVSAYALTATYKVDRQQCLSLSMSPHSSSPFLSAVHRCFYVGNGRFRTRRRRSPRACLWSAYLARIHKIVIDVISPAFVARIGCRKFCFHGERH